MHDETPGSSVSRAADPHPRPRKPRERGQAMTFRTPARALAAVLALAAADAQAQVHAPVHNNPIAQGNMYNVTSGPLRFNNPTNQVGMYGSDPVLRFNDPLNQGNLIPGGFNNPLTQGNGMVVGGM